MPGTIFPDRDGGRQPDPGPDVLAAVLDTARGLADVDVTSLPDEAQAGWARMTRPVLRYLLDALEVEAERAGAGL